MSDEEVRSLEHAWAQTRDPAAEARLLVARRRAGRLDLARLEIASFLGHGPAIAALEAAAPAGVHVPRARWRTALDEGARAPFVRLEVGLLAQEFATWSPVLITPEIEDWAAPAEAWLACPCERHAVVAAEVAARIVPRMDLPSRRTRRVLFAMSAELRRGDGGAAQDEARDLADLALGALHDAHATSVSSPAGRDAVVRWALGAEHSFVAGVQAEEVAYLAARLASGELTQERLEVAAHAGDAAACRLLGRAVEAEPGSVEWALELVRWDAGWLFLLLAGSILLGGGGEENAWGEIAGHQPPLDPSERELLFGAYGALRAWVERGAELGPALAQLERLPPEVLRADDALSFRGRLATLVEGIVRARVPTPADVARLVRAPEGHLTMQHDCLAGWALALEEPFLRPGQRVVLR